VLLSSNLRLIAGGLTLVVSAVTGVPALAQQETANLNVTAQILASCVVNGGSLDFGLYAPGAETGKEGEGSFSYVCTEGTNISLNLGAGQNAEGDSRAMALAGGGGTLTYQLYKDAGHSDAWGLGTGGKDVPETSAEQTTVDVYGLIGPGQDSPAGSYSDVVQITLNINP
jgi:spore coat protein U-like protein